MTRTLDVVVVGSLNRDYVCRVDELPVPGQTVLGGEATVCSGGKGGNQAVAASLLGARTAMVGRVGRDDDGRALVADLATAWVDTTEVVATTSRTGMAFVLVDAAGENTIAVAPGANQLLEEHATASAVRRLVGGLSVVVTQAEIPPSVFDVAIRTAADLDCRAVVNLAPYRPVPDDLLALCDPLVVNESEASGLLDRQVVGVDAAHEAAAELLTRTRSVVVTVGAGGAVVACSDGVHHMAASAVGVVDTTGAGDAFTGALAAALSAGWSVVDATRVGVRAGSYAVGRPGAQGSFPTASTLGLGPLHVRR